MRVLILMLGALVVAGCASASRSGKSEEALVAELVTIREFDGHTGFGTSEGRKSYGWQAERELVDRGQCSVPALLAALKDPNLDRTQKWIVRHAIEKLGQDARLAVPVLVSELDGADPKTAARILRVLSHIGRPAASSVPDLLRLHAERGNEVVTPTIAVADVVMPESHLRDNVVMTLASIGYGADAALPVLAEGAVQTDDVVYRTICRNAMRRILSDATMRQ